MVVLSTTNRQREAQTTATSPQHKVRVAVAVIGRDRFMRQWASVIILTLCAGQSFSGYSGAQKDDAVSDFEESSGGRVVFAVQPV